MQAPTPRRAALATATVALVVLAMATPAAGATMADGPDRAASFSGPSCKTTAVHDAFLNDSAVVATAANGSASTVDANTQVTVEQSTGFVRVKGENPNGYCVEYEVRIHSKIVTPSTVGEVAATDAENLTAGWQAVHNFESQRTYTRVRFALPANTTASFAPLELKIQSLAWAGQAEAQASGFLGGIEQTVHNYTTDELEKKEYKFSPETNTTSIITVSLRNESQGRAVEEWLAYYRRGAQASWQPIGQDSTAPVFYRTINDGDDVQFIFNDENATVKFVANPGWTEETQHQFSGYMSGVRNILDGFGLSLPFFVGPAVPMGVLAGLAPASRVAAGGGRDGAA